MLIKILTDINNPESHWGQQQKKGYTDVDCLLLGIVRFDRPPEADK